MSAYIRSRLITAIGKFNEQDYFECHEILEDIWFDVHNNTKDIYQGLLHYATALYHLTKKNNIKGTLMQLEKAADKLSVFTENFQGIDIPKVLRQIKSLHKRLIKGEAPKKLPRIKIS